MSGVIKVPEKLEGSVVQMSRVQSSALLCGGKERLPRKRGHVRAAVCLPSLSTCCVVGTSEGRDGWGEEGA